MSKQFQGWYKTAPRAMRPDPDGGIAPADVVGKRFLVISCSHHPELVGEVGVCVERYSYWQQIRLRFDHILIDGWAEDAEPIKVPLEDSFHYSRQLEEKTT